MSRPTILVTGATGKTGRAIIGQLAAVGWPVRALVHRHDARSAEIERLGAEVAVADLFDAAQVRDALRGTQRAYWCAPFHPQSHRAAAIFAEAASENRLEAIVGLSQWLASPTHPALATRQTWQADRLFSSLSGIGYTIVDPGFFADNYLRLIGFAAQLGVLPSLTGDSRNAPPSNEDIARVAVAVLVDPQRHAGKSYRPTGPELLNTADMALILGRVLGRTVRRVEMPMWLFVKAARMQGVGAFELAGFRHYVRDHKQGAFALGAPTSDVLDLTGEPPEGFETIAMRYARMPEAERSLTSRARAWVDFMRTPFMPGYDLSSCDSATDLPAPEITKRAMDDAEWVATHGARTQSLRPA